MLSVDEIRSQFPALERRHAGRTVAYFDGPGGTQVPRAVADAMVDYLFHHNANTHWAYPSSAETDRILEEARRTLADLLGAGPEEVAFGQNMTTLTLHAARALSRTWAEGDVVVVTELDHHANVDPWREAARDRGARVEQVRMDPASGTLDWADLERRLSGRVRLLAVGAASNALGTITDVRRAVALAREAGARTFVDAVHFAPHARADVRDIGCDFLACSPYKFYGPHLGVLFGRRELMDSLPFPRLVPAGQRAPERAETGTLSHEAIAGAAAAVDFIASIGDGATRAERLDAALAGLHARGERLLRRLWDGLEAVPGVRLFGPRPGEPRTPTVAFTVEGLDPEEVTRRLAELAVFVSHGDFYARTVVERLGLAEAGGLVRAGCACYTTEEEVDRLVAGVAAIAR